MATYNLSDEGNFLISRHIALDSTWYERTHMYRLISTSFLIKIFSVYFVGLDSSGESV